MKLRFLKIAGLTIGGLLIGGIVLVHTPPAKRFAFSKLQQVLAEQGIKLKGSGFSYNLFSLSAELRDVEVQAEPSLPPLAKIGSMSLDLSLTDLIRGYIVVSNATLVKPEIYVVVDANGLSNLPKSKSETKSETEFLLNKLIVTGGSLRYEDRQQGMSLVLPKWDAKVDGTRANWRHKVEFAAAEAGSATYQGKQYPIEAVLLNLDAGKNDLQIERLRLAAAGAALTGSLAVNDFDNPSVDGQLTLDAELGPVVPDAAGAVHIEANLKGPADALIVDGTLSASDVAYREYKGVAADANFRYDGGKQRASASDLTITSPYGRLSGAGDIALKNGESRVDAKFSGVNLARFDKRLATTASGSVQARFEALEFEKARGRAIADLRANALPQPDVYPVSGRIEATGSGTAANINLRNVQLANVTANGNVRVTGKERLSGQVTAQTEDIAAQPYAKSPVSGPATFTADLGGTISRPAAQFTLDAPSLTAPEQEGIALHISGNYVPEAVTLDQATLDWGAQQLRASGKVGLKGDNAPLSLRAEVSDADIANVLATLRRTDIPAAGTVNLNAAINGTVAKPQGVVELDVANLEAYGEKLGHLTATANVDRTQVVVPDLTLEKSPDEVLRAQASYNLDTRAFSAKVNSDPLKLTRGTFALQADAQGTPEDPRGTARVTGELPDVGPVEANLQLAGKQATVNAAASRQNLTVTANASTEAPYPLTFDVRAQGTDFASLPVELPETLKGTVTARVQGSGEAENWKNGTLQLNVEPLDIQYNGHAIRTAGPLVASVNNQVVTLEPVTVTGPGSRVELAGTLPGSLRISGDSNVGEVWKAFEPEGPQFADGKLAIQGTLESSLQNDRLFVDPRLTVNLTDGFFLQPNVSPVSNAQLALTTKDGRVRIETLSASWSNAEITGTANAPFGLLPADLPVDLPRPLGPAQAELSVKGLDFSTIQGIPEDIGGQTSLTLTAEASTPKIEAVDATLRFDDLKVRAASITLAQDSPSTIRVQNGTARVENFLLKGPQNAQVALQGTAGLLGARPLDVKLNSNLDLSLLAAFTEDLRARGPAELSVAATGTLDKPDLNGYLRITDADFGMSEPRVQAESFNLRVDLAGQRINIAQLRGNLNGGTLEGSGGATLAGSDLQNVDIRLNTKGTYLDFPANLKTLSDASITLRSVNGRLLLGGNVGIIEGSYTEPINLDQGLLNVLNSPPDTGLTKDRSEFLSKLDYGLGIKTRSPLVIDNNLAKVEIEMDARLTGTFYRPGLTGQVNILEGGELNLNEREYIVDRGILTFTDENKIDPSFDVVARTQAAGYDITLSVQGSGKERETTLRADPDLPEPDIAAILLTGRTLDELRGNEADVAKEQVLSYLTGRVGGTLGRSIEQATGLSTVRIEPNLIANESDPSARLTVGQDITRKLSLIYSMNLTDSGDQILVGQYDLTRRFRTRALKQSDNSYRFDFSRKQEFGGTPPPASSTSEREKRTIGDVDISNPKPIFTDDQLRKWLSARSGKRYDFFKIRRGVEKINDKHAKEGYLEARVRLTRDQQAREVDLDLKVEAGPKVDFVYEGFKPSGDTRDKIREKWQSGVFDAQRADDVVTLLRDQLLRDGYVQAKIDYQIATPETDRKRVVFDIQTGAKFDKVSLVFAGASGIKESELRDVLKEQKLADTAYAHPKQPIELLQAYYRENGYLDAKIAEPELVVDAPAKKAQVIFPVVEGPQYVVDQIKFSGNDKYTAAELQNVTTMESGLPYRPARREETISNLIDLYARKGYNDTDIKYLVERRPEAGKIDINFRVDEGPRTVVKEVAVSGRDYTSENLIRSQLGLKPGDPLDPQVLAKSRRDLYSTGAYSLIDVQRQVGVMTPNEKLVSLDVKVREVRPFMVNYGGYFDTDRGPGGIVDIANRNMLGSARVIGLRTRYDRDLQEGRLYYSQPLLRRFPVRTTGASFMRREVREGFNTDRVGFSVLQEARFRQNWVLNYGYRLEKTHTYDRGPDPLFDVQLRVAPFTVSLLRDTRDDLLDATKGSFTSHAVEYAPTYSGSELNFAKYFGQYFRYFALSKPRPLPLQENIRKSRLVYATGVRVGLASGLNGQELIPGRSQSNRVALGERFFAGGGTTIRGFSQDGVGPRMFDGVSPTGGDALFVLNNEIRFPMFSIFDGASFVDVGNVYNRLEDFRPWQVRKTAGFGIRVRTPYFLIRLDYGIKLDRKPGEPLGRPFFSIGQAF